MESKWVFKETDALADDYILGDQIGEAGQYGVAKKCQRKSDGKKFAVKIIDKKRFFYCLNADDLWDDMRAEIGVLQTLQHVNIIKLFDVYETPGELYLITELCTGGELWDQITKRDRFTEKDASGVVQQILKGLAHMHEKNIAHCDLKPENLLFTGDGVLKIIDFGMSRKLPASRYLRRLCGTPYYTAPEILRGKYHMSADCWAVGVIIFLMLYGYPPFYVSREKYGNKENEMIYRKIKKGFIPRIQDGFGRHFPSTIKTSDEARDLMKSLLRKDVAARLTAVESLDHKWFMNSSSDQVISEQVRASLNGIKRANNFKVAVLQLFKDVHIDAEKRNLLKKSFDEMDLDKDGVISWQEFQSSMIKSGTIAEVKLRKVFEASDFNKNQVISFDELLLTVADHQLRRVDERLYKMFLLLDKDKDGFLSAAEIKEYVGDRLKDDPIAKDLGILENIDTIIKDADTDNDGLICWNEFFRAIHPDDFDEEEEDEKVDLGVQMESRASIFPNAPFGNLLEDSKECS